MSSERKTSSYFVIYKDGDVKELKSKKEVESVVVDDDGSGHIKQILKGFDVPFGVKKISQASLGL